MSDDMETLNGSGRVTMRMLMEELEKFRSYLDERFTRLESTISDSYQRKDVCRERYQHLCAQINEVDAKQRATVEAAVQASQDDRQKIWTALHRLDADLDDVKLKAAVASVFVAILTSVITAVLVKWVIG